MTQQTINVGTNELAGDGESLRTAFQKVNSNFTELYTTGGPRGYDGSQGVVGFTGSTGTQGNVGYTGSEGTQGTVGFTGSTGTAATVTIGSVTVSTSTASVTNVGDIYNAVFDFTLQQGPQGASPNFSAVAEHIIPDTDVTYDLGSTSSQWRSLYVGTSTIYLGGNALSILNSTLTVNGMSVQSENLEIDGGYASTDYTAELIIDGNGA